MRTTGADGARQPMKAVHLKEGKPNFKPSVALRPYPNMLEALEVKLDRKRREVSQRRLTVNTDSQTAHQMQYPVFVSIL